MSDNIFNDEDEYSKGIKIIRGQIELEEKFEETKKWLREQREEYFDKEMKRDFPFFSGYSNLVSLINETDIDLLKEDYRIGLESKKTGVRWIGTKRIV